LKITEKSKGKKITHFPILQTEAHFGNILDYLLLFFLMHRIHTYYKNKNTSVHSVISQYIFSGNILLRSHCMAVPYPRIGMYHNLFKTPYVCFEYTLHSPTSRSEDIK
jgi:hypothetical protein